MRSLKQKLLVTILPLCLVPLVAISWFSYYQAKERITEDRSVLYLEQIAQGVADTIQLTVLEKREEAETMSLLLSDFVEADRRGAKVRREATARKLLNNLVKIHEVYDLLVLFDLQGRILLTSSINRNQIERELDAESLRQLVGSSTLDYTPDGTWLQQVRSGRTGFLDWHPSQLVSRLYNYEKDDIARQYNIGFAAPVADPQGIVVGGVLAVMNWEYIQEILDLVETELEARSLSSGYAFLFGRDRDTIIGHKYRRNRDYRLPELTEPVVRGNYGTSLRRDHGLIGLAEQVAQLEPDPIRRLATHYSYEYPAGTAKISGLAPVDHDFFHWVCGVGINDEDIFAPVQDLKKVLVAAALLTSALVILLTFWVARQISIPVKKLTLGAAVIAGGDLSQRVEVSSRDEIGELADKFNEMAQSLDERSQALLDLNLELERKVEERTRELQLSHAETEQAYQELKTTQVQLIQSEKMASLGQLVSGIAHEIKNPLNFIYGNTDFLKKYVEQLRELIAIYSAGEADARTKKAAVDFKRRVNFDFVQEDLDTLIQNFEDGAKRIHAIIGELRAFSRMDSETLRPVDIQEPIELALNLIRHEYRDRITIHRDYGAVPKVECHSGKISQVFMNLLANACQAIPEQGDIWITSRRLNGQVEVEIRDNGRGIEPEHLNKVFEPFFTTKPVGHGTGLGLSISYGIIQQHRGEIQVSSAPGEGTSFRITLPINHE